MRKPAETANEPYPRASSEDCACLELRYRVRPAGAALFGEEQLLCIADIARVGRLDPEQWTAPDVALPADDVETSRHHGVVALTRVDGLHLTYFDLRSENGTFLGDKPIMQCPVLPGLRLRLGQSDRRSEIHFVDVCTVVPSPADLWPHASRGELHGESAPMRRLFAALHDVTTRGASSPLVVLQGASGTGKKAAMWEVLHGWYPQVRPPVRYVDCRWVALDGGPQPLLALLQGAGSQVLVLDHLYGLSTRHQQALGLVLQRLVAGQFKPPVPRVVVLLRAGEPQRQRFEVRDGGLLKVLHTAPGLWLPSAAVCGASEALRFAQRFLARYKAEAPTGNRFTISACELSPGALAVLGQETWPQNWRQLRSVVEGAALAVAMDGRHLIEAEDLQIGFSELNLPLDLIYERPLPEAEKIFRCAYVFANARRNSGNMTWMAPAMGYSKRGVLKTAKDIGMHDGEQLTPPPVPTWILQEPRQSREDGRLRVALPSGLAWSHAVTAAGGDGGAVRRRLVELLDLYPATTITQTLADLSERHCFTLEALERALRTRKTRRRGGHGTAAPSPARTRST